MSIQVTRIKGGAVCFYDFHEMLLGAIRGNRSVTFFEMLAELVLKNKGIVNPAYRFSVEYVEYVCEMARYNRLEMFTRFNARYHDELVRSGDTEMCWKVAVESGNIEMMELFLDTLVVPDTLGSLLWKSGYSNANSRFIRRVNRKLCG